MGTCDRLVSRLHASALFVLFACVWFCCVGARCVCFPILPQTVLALRGSHGLGHSSRDLLKLVPRRHRGAAGAQTGPSRCFQMLEVSRFRLENTKAVIFCSERAQVRFLKKTSNLAGFPGFRLVFRKLKISVVFISQKDKTVKFSKLPSGLLDSTDHSAIGCYIDR